MKAAEDNKFTLLPRRDQLGRRILLFQIGNFVLYPLEKIINLGLRSKCQSTFSSFIANWKPEISSLVDGWKFAIILAEIGAYEPASQIAGGELIFDMKGLNWQHVRQFNPFIARKLVNWFQVIAITNRRYSFQNYIRRNDVANLIILERTTEN